MTEESLSRLIKDNKISRPGAGIDVWVMVREKGNISTALPAICDWDVWGMGAGSDFKSFLASIISKLSFNRIPPFTRAVR